MPRADQGDIAWGNMLRQHVGKPRTEGFVRSLFGPMTEAAKALDGISMDLDAADTAQLDLIGSIVGQSRVLEASVFLEFFGYASQPAGRGYGQARYRSEGEPFATSYTAPDVEYRALIRAKIALNNSRGTLIEMAAAAARIYAAPIASARTLRGGVAEVWVGRIPLPTEAVQRLPETLVPRAAGVRVGVVFYNPSATFGYAGQANAVGYGQGPYARTSPSNTFPIS